MTQHGLADTSHHFTICGLNKAAIAVASSLTWMVVSSALILLNKDLLSHGFHYPMALSGLGMAFSSMAAFLCCRVFRLVEAKRTVSWSFYVLRILPVGLLMALTLHFGNLVYLYLSVSFIQMLKAFSPILTMIALFIAGLEKPTRKLIASVGIIALGTMLSSLGEVNLDWLGVLIIMASEVFEAMRLVMTQTLLTGLRFHPIEGLMYLAPACTFWLGLGSLVFELPKMVEEEAFSLVAAHPIKFLVAAAMGFGVNALGYIVIQSASSLTLKVLGTVKNALVVWIGIVFLQETVTLLQGVGYGLSIGAFFIYQQLKMAELKATSSLSNLAELSVGSRDGDSQPAIGRQPRYVPVKTEEPLKKEEV